MTGLGHVKLNFDRLFVDGKVACQVVNGIVDVLDAGNEFLLNRYFDGGHIVFGSQYRVLL